MLIGVLFLLPLMSSSFRVNAILSHSVMVQSVWLQRDVVVTKGSVGDSLWCTAIPWGEYDLSLIGSSQCGNVFTSVSFHAASVTTSPAEKIVFHTLKLYFCIKWFMAYLEYFPKILRKLWTRKEWVWVDITFFDASVKFSFVILCVLVFIEFSV